MESIEIKQEDGDDEIEKAALVKLDHSPSYPNYDADCYRMEVEEVKINNFNYYNEYELPSSTFNYMEDKPAVDDGIENIKDESCVNMDTLHHPVEFIKIESSASTNETYNSPLKGIKSEQEDMLAVDVKVEQQEFESYMGSTKLEVLAEELDFKPDSCESDNENPVAELNRFAKKKIIGKEHSVVTRNTDKGSFICYCCNLIVHSKKDLIDHINVGDCSLKDHAKKSVTIRNRLHESNEYICTKCNKIFKSIVARDDHVVQTHVELISSVSSEIYQCKHCSYKTTIASHLSGHMRKHPETGCSVKGRPCIHCDKTFKTKVGFDNHIIKNHREFIASVSSKIHQCKYCSYQTTFSNHLASHMTKHPETGCSVERKPCMHCDKTFKSKPALDDHVIKNHKEFVASVSSKIHRCKYCSYQTTSSHNLTSHMTNHPESGCSVKRIPCIHCKKTFKAKVGLDDHIIKHHKQFIASVSSKIYQCKHCSYQTTYLYQLARHITKHPETGCSVERIPCIHCNKTFKRKANLDDHVIKNHKEFVASVSSKIHQCRHCSYKTTYSTELARHITMHSEIECSVKPSPCMHCHKTFKRKVALDDHVIKNHKEFIASVSSKIYQCKHCSYQTTNAHNWTSHMTKHSGIRESVERSPCIRCGKIFKSKQALDDHVIKNHKEFIASVTSKIYKCKHCSYQTTYSSELARHITKHPEAGCSVERRLCIHCDKTFMRKAALDDHIIKNHKEFVASVTSKIHQCKHCNYKTTISSELARHVAKHTGTECSVKRSPCMHCDKRFERKRDLDDHVIKNHQEFIKSVSSKIYQCEHCSYKTTYSSDFARHITRHPQTECDRKQLPC